MHGLTATERHGAPVVQMATQLELRVFQAIRSRPPSISLRELVGIIKDESRTINNWLVSLRKKGAVVVVTRGRPGTHATTSVYRAVPGVIALDPPLKRGVKPRSAPKPHYCPTHRVRLVFSHQTTERQVVGKCPSPLCKHTSTVSVDSTAGRAIFRGY